MHRLHVLLASLPDWAKGALFTAALGIIGWLVLKTPTLWSVFLDWRYGKFRPTRREIDVMPAAEYGRRLRQDPKFGKWVNRVLPKQPPQKPFDPNEW